MVRGEFGKLALGSGQVTDAQHRAAPDRAAFDRHVSLLQRGEREGEALAFGAQRIDGGLHRMGVAGGEPGTEREHTPRQGRTHDERNIARDIGLVRAGRPHDNDLRLGEQQRIRAVALLAQLVDFGLPVSKLLRGSPARPQQHDCGCNRKQNDAKAECERGNLMPLERHQRIDIVGERTQRRLRLGGCRVRQHNCCPGDDGLAESAAPRLRFLPAPSPDRVRHFPVPLRRSNPVRETARPKPR